MLIDRLLYYIKHPKYILLWLDLKRVITLDDRKILTLLYEKTMNKKLNLDKLRTFNEKLQWLKLYDSNNIYTTMVDKYDSKEYIIPTLGIYDTFEKIDFDKLPNQFVLKRMYDSESTLFYSAKFTLDIDFKNKQLTTCFNKNYYYDGREWPYMNVNPKKYDGKVYFGELTFYPISVLEEVESSYYDMILGAKIILPSKLV